MPFPVPYRIKQLESHIDRLKLCMDEEIRRYDGSKQPQNRNESLNKLDKLAGKLLTAEKELVDISEKT